MSIDGHAEIMTTSFFHWSTALEAGIHAYHYTTQAEPRYTALEAGIHARVRNYRRTDSPRLEELRSV
jgi:adenine deaminase